ncbi:MAG: tRNA (N6-threonylcarbamoyladenosine(37)-N6)-methyltransferase TrmO [Bdellovibrionales bacterium]|nr:tRNA (N6-threonylcarbamoyladenosine(37)-N6)-methyltransferase TrmO [Bdellovibrionales bacterium]
MKPIGIISTCFQEKFGVPRQSMMVKEAKGLVRFFPVFSNPECFLHLQGFSHLWLIYVFHKNQTENHPGLWKPTIQPPRVEAPPKVGVFASRSPHRPNPIGMSVVKFDGIRHSPDGCAEILVSGVDILDGTPLLDVKPYLPFADCVQDAESGWIKNEVERYPIEFSEDAKDAALKSGIFDLIVEVLEWDPRPRSQREHVPIHDPASSGRRFAFRLMGYDIQWEIGPRASIRVIGIRLV